jgi:outer membrane protein OmpA-like peptidoglycan-associated protein
MKVKYLIYMTAFLSLGVADLFYLNSKVIPTLWSDKKLTIESAPTVTPKPKPNRTIATIQTDHGTKDDVAALIPDTIPTNDTQYTEIEEKHAQSVLVLKILVQYKTGEYKLSPNYRKRLLTELKKNTLRDNISVTIDGHADRRGAGYFNNKLLSLQRAEYIAAFLKQQGVLEDQITINGYGDAKPLDRDDTIEAYKKNRRAEIKIFKDTP